MIFFINFFVSVQRLPLMHFELHVCIQEVWLWCFISTLRNVIVWYLTSLYGILDNLFIWTSLVCVCGHKKKIELNDKHISMESSSVTVNFSIEVPLTFIMTDASNKCLLLDLFIHLFEFTNQVWNIFNKYFQDSNVFFVVKL